MVACHQIPAKKSFIFQIARNLIVIFALNLVSGFLTPSIAISEEKMQKTVEEEIWQLEEAYFTNLYKANYEGVLDLVHQQFLGWPGNLQKPINREESAEFMKKLIPQPTECSIRIERFGLQYFGDTVLTQYVVHVDLLTSSGTVKTLSSRITHTWIRDNGKWKILGGMSSEIKKE